MIVQSDFLDHWKTQMLIDLLDDPCAPIYVIRLWAHCQNRKTHRFPRVNPSVTKAICHAKCDPQLFHDSMIIAGFIRVEGDVMIAHDWDDVNSSLIANWENGKKGGRPSKKNPSKTHGLTQTKPTHNPSITDKRREEKIREEQPPEKVDDELLFSHPEYRHISSCEELNKISIESYLHIKQSFPKVRHEEVVKMAVLKAKDPDKEIKSQFQWLVSQFRYADEIPESLDCSHLIAEICE